MIYNLYLGVGLMVAIVFGTVIMFVFRGGLKRGLDNLVMFCDYDGWVECWVWWRFD
jgi:hypothetical protein